MDGNTKQKCFKYSAKDTHLIHFSLLCHITNKYCTYIHYMGETAPIPNTKIITVL